MEESCRATPLVLAGRDSKSPLQVPLSSPESDGMKSPSRDSPDSRCVICLGKLQNKSFTDSCLHQFCFQCLLQWSKIKAECPLCKQPFKSIIHNVRSNLDYDQYHVEHREPRYVLSDFVHSYNFDLIPVDRRFRYRSTMTREYFREIAEYIAQTRRFSEDSYQIPPIVPVDPAPTLRSGRPHRGSGQRPRHQGTSDFRRNIYAQDLWVQDLVDISGRYRECTPQFYRENPAQIHRIIPWLNREVNVLCECESHAAYVLSRIVSILTQHSIRSREFRELVQPYFGARTDHFVHELYTFARSVYDIAGFDQNAVYVTNPNYATEVQEISSSSDDSDIEVLETFRNSENKLKKSSRQGLKKVLLKKDEKGESKVDEPVAGPSGLNSSGPSNPIEICESDPEEIKVLDYVKPEPEVVTLSSGEDSIFLTRQDLSNEEYEELNHEGRKKLSKDRLSSTDEYLPSFEKRKKKHKDGKGKCKSNGFGLKGKQRSKYSEEKTKRSRSSSSSDTSSSNSSSSSSSSSSSIATRSSRSHRRSRSISTVSSQSSGHKSNKHKKKKLKISSSKYKKKKMYKSSRKIVDSKRHNKSSSRSNSESKRTSRKKRKVKSCVIVPGSNFCDSSTPPSRDAFSSRVSADPKHHLPVHHSFEPYWSLGSSSRRKKENWPGSRVIRSKRRHKARCSEESSSKRYRDCSSSERSSNSYYDVEITSNRKSSPVEHSKIFKSRGDKVESGNSSSAENEKFSVGNVDVIAFTSTSSSLASNYSDPTVTSPNSYVNFD